MNRRTFLFGATAGALAGHIFGAAAARQLGTIAYVQIDGLWVRALPDGEPRKLVGGPVLFPRFSPSGQWIFYTQNDAGFVVSVDGKQVSRIGNSAAWAPVSDGLWVNNENSDALELFGARNGWASPIATIPGASLGVFSPDGAEMTYAQVDQTGSDADVQLSTRLCRVALKDGARPAVLQTTSEDWEVCAWTRDGKSIVYWRQEEFSVSEASDGDELFLMPASGGKPRSLGLTTLLDADFVALSPNRNELALAAGGGRYEWFNKRIAVVDLDNSAVHYLTAENTTGLSPSWSPDGSRIAYSAGPAPAPEEESDLECGCDEASQKRLNELFSQRRIWVSGRAGAQPPRQLSGDSQYHDEAPQWSADGRSILFTRSDSAFTDIQALSSDGKTLWVMDQDGGNLIQVAGPLYIDPDFGGARRSAFDWFRGRA
jgi:Tol biopolymer transport system component